MKRYLQSQVRFDPTAIKLAQGNVNQTCTRKCCQRAPELSSGRTHICEQSCSNRCEPNLLSHSQHIIHVPEYLCGLAVQPQSLNSLDAWKPAVGVGPRREARSVYNPPRPPATRGVSKHNQLPANSSSFQLPASSFQLPASSLQQSAS